MNGDEESGQRNKFREEAAEFSMESLKLKAPTDIQGEIFSSAVEVRYGTQEGVWTRDECLGVSEVAVVKTMVWMKWLKENMPLRTCRFHLPAHRHNGLR